MSAVRGFATSPSKLRAPPLSEHSHTLVETAPRADATIAHLGRHWPECSAATPMPLGQALALIGTVSILPLLFTLGQQEVGVSSLLIALSIGLLCPAILRLGALANLQRSEGRQSLRISIEDLPPYTVLVPLYREAEIVPETIAALSRLIYARDKLEVLFLLEEDDDATCRAFEASPHPAWMKALTVPNGLPRTKPRALCYAMTVAKGDYITIYDAEDLPDPSQLIRAVAHFQAHPETGCLQCRLNIDNREENWLTRQFAIEYSALFDALLPALERWNLPIPLGGTSNHFQRAILEGAGGWDPYNVTEDADLGIRLARLGWRVRVDTSTTWEEAPPNLTSWLRQRTRWIKGWMQTYLVHMRMPLCTMTEMGLKGFIGLQVLMVAQVLSPLLHPWAILLVAAHVNEVAVSGGIAEAPYTAALLGFALFNLILGYGSGMALGYKAASQRGFYSLLPGVALMPIYWLLISVAAHRALLQIIVKPFLWEKTPHRGRRQHAKQHSPKPN